MKGFLMQIRKLMLTGIVCCGAAATIANADVFNGTLYYTNFTGGVNVNRVDYSYDDVSHALTLSNQTGLASLAGADGIIFDGAGHLLVGGQNTNLVYRLNPDGTGITSRTAGSGSSFHLALSPDGNTVYTSPFGGPIEALGLSPFSNGTVQNITATDGDFGITQLAFAPNSTVFYVDGSPNGGGTLGRLTNLGGVGNAVTNRFSIGGVTSAHGLVYDSFTGLMTTFGAGAVGTFDPNQATDATLAASLKQRSGINADFDQGSVDGQGHAFIAGNGQITFIDYRASGDITNAANFVAIRGGFSGIDDLAPLSGLGSSTVPEPTSIALLVTVLAGVAYSRKRRIV